MKNEPALPIEQIRDLINCYYKLNLRKLDFLPIGEGSWCYRGTGENTVFVRLVKNSNAVLKTNDLIQLLAGYNFPVLPPLSHKYGQTVARIENYGLVVYPYLEGLTVMRSGLNGQQLTTVRQEIGAITALLHELTEQVNHQIDLPTEDFTKFQPEFHSIVCSNRKPDCHDQLIIDWMRFIQERKSELTNLLQVTEQLGNELRSRKSDYVLCHGDIHEDNIIMASSGGLYIIDWDNAILAPKERDLFFFGENENNLKQYFSLLSSKQAEPAIIDYYVLEWALQEIVDYSNRILSNSFFSPEGRLDAWHQFQSLFKTNQDVDRAYQIASHYM